MSKLDLKVRNLESGETLLATFESEDDASTWLKDRPPMMEVLGVATHGLPREVYAMLRADARPLDADERALLARIVAAEEAAERRRAEEEQALEEAEQAAHRESMRSADPDRPMGVRWTYAGGFERMDSVDEREISDDARKAVQEFIDERNGWVHPRGMMVDEVQVVVWPGRLPPGITERVQPGGQFFPAPLPELGAS